MKTTLEMIEIMQAFADGKEIEWYCGGWVKCEKPTWNWGKNDYRIAEKKPVLVPHWPAIIKSTTGCYVLTDHVFPNLDTAKSRFNLSVIRLATEYPYILLEVES